MGPDILNAGLPLKHEFIVLLQLTPLQKALLRAFVQVAAPLALHASRTTHATYQMQAYRGTRPQIPAAALSGCTGLGQVRPEFVSRPQLHPEALQLA